MKHIKNIDPDCPAQIISEEILESVGAYTILLLDSSVIIYLSLDNINSFDVIVHEAFHATEFIMDFVGIPHCTETSEAFAYLLQYIVNEITK